VNKANKQQANGGMHTMWWWWSKHKQGEQATSTHKHTHNMTMVEQMQTRQIGNKQVGKVMMMK
jgi:hypothetical protein